MGALRLERIDRPRPRAGEALVAVEAAALNFSDLLMIDDTYQVRPPRPFTPGQEIGGIVIASGEGSRLRPGQPVVSKVEWGGFGEYAVVTDAMAIALPDGTDLARAVALPVSYVTALIALEHCGRLQASESLLVHGAAGAVGLAAVQLGRAIGCQVIAAASAPDKRTLALEHGASAVVDSSDGGWVDAVRAVTKGAGANVVFDPVGGEIATESLRCLAWEGRLLIVGFASGKIPVLPANRLLLKRAAAVGVYWSHERDGALVKAMETRLVEMFRSGIIRPHVETRSGLDALPQALQDLAARRTRGKLVLCMEPTG